MRSCFFTFMPGCGFGFPGGRSGSQEALGPLPPRVGAVFPLLSWFLTSYNSMHGHFLLIHIIQKS